MKNMANYFFSLVLFFLLLPSVLIAQPTSFRFTHFGSEQGLQQSVIRKILQDKTGFIWIATENGLNRFDSYDFKLYRKKQNSNSLSWNHIYCIAEDTGSGLLWLGTAFNGVDVLDPVTDSIIHVKGAVENSGLLDKNITCIRILSKSVLAGNKKGLSVINKSTFVVQKNIATTSEVRTVVYDMQTRQSLVFCRNNQVLLLDSLFSVIRVFTYEDLLKNKNTDLWEVDCTSDGVYWFCTKEGIYSSASFNDMIQGKIEKKEFILNGKNYGSENYTTVFRDSKSRYWVAADSVGIILLNDQQLPQQILSHKPGNPYGPGDINVTQVFEDKQHNMWVATEKGLDKISVIKPFISTYGLEDDPLMNRLNRIFTLFTPDDNIIFLSQLGQLNIFNRTNSGITAVKNKAAIDFARTYFVTPFKEKQWLVGSREGVLILQKTGESYEIDFPVAYPELLSFKKRINSVLSLNANDFLLGSIQNAGLSYWQPGSHTLQTFLHDNEDPFSIADNNINCIYKGRDNTIWLSTGKGFSSFDPLKKKFINHLVKFNTTARQSNINDIYDDGKYLWLAAYQEGLVRWDKKNDSYTVYGEDNGLPTSSIYNIRSDGNGNLWISSATGLIVFNTAREIFRVYTKEDGLQDNEFNRFAVFETEKNLYFGGISGFSIIEKSKSQIQNEAATVRIVEVKYLSGNRYIAIPGIPDHLTLSARSNSFEINFSTFNYSNPRHEQYEYMLKGWDKDWIYSANRHEVNYSNIPPGNYLFLVRSANPGNDPSFLTSLPIEIIPLWYQTLLFKIIVFLLLLSVLYAFYYYRILHKKRVEKMRATISSNLHDEIGSTLSSINIYADLAKKEIVQSTYIESINQNVTDVINKLDDLVWGINPKYDSINNIISRLRSYAEPLTQARGILLSITSKLPEHDIKLASEIKHDIYLMVKELINNAIKHSQCRHVQIEFAALRKQLLVSVEDDGKGFDAAGMRKNRNGLGNIAHRVAAMKGSLDTETGTGKGTRTTIRIPV